MTRPTGPPPAAPAPDPDEDALVLRVLGALLREDAAGLRSRGTVDGGWLTLPGRDGGPGPLMLAVGPDGFQAELTARLPLLRRPGGPDATGCDAVLAALAEHADPRDRAGWQAFAEECRRELEAARLHRVQLPLTRAELTARHGADTARWQGHRGALAHDALAAFAVHPVHPASRGRAGFAEPQLRSCAPEFLPVVRPRWVLLPRAAVTVSGGLTGDPCWPSPARLGLPELAATHLALPVHPLTGAAELAAALREAGLERDAVPARRPHLELLPTLSTRTAALADDPARHLKLPLPTATLGRLNRRTIKPGTLTDGTAGQALLAAVLEHEPRFAGRILLADETRWAHAGHELLAVLLRLQPAGLEDACVVPLAALLAAAPDPAAGPQPAAGGPPLVIDQLARRYFGGRPAALVEALLTLLFDWQTTLLSCGIALESHQQNVSLVLDRPGGGPTRTRLLFKDNDGPRVDPDRLRATLGTAPPRFADPRVLTSGFRPLTDVFTTITVHLCAASLAFGLARAGRLPLEAGLALLRRTLTAAADRRDPATRQALYDHVLDAGRLPVKAMVTAGTLLTKERSGAADINKHYTDGPNYLRAAAGP